MPLPMVACESKLTIVHELSSPIFTSLINTYNCRRYNCRCIVVRDSLMHLIVSIQILYTSLTLDSCKNHELESDANSPQEIEEKGPMEIDDDKKLKFNQQTEDDIAETDNCEPLIHTELSDDICPMETDMSIVSAEIPERRI